MKSMGNFSGLSWGNSSSKKPVLLVHGLQHNCGAFNKLIPMLYNNYSFVAIDLPGHGRSSHFPLGLPLDFFNFVHSIKRVIDHLKWTSFIYIGHSFGSQIGTYFAAIFPQYIESLIVIDSMEPRPVPLGQTLKRFQFLADKFIHIDEKLEKGEPPVYSYEEAYNKTQKNNFWPLKPEATKDLLERSLKSFKKGYTFVNDQRLKCIVGPVLIFEQQKEILDNVVCPVLFLLAEDNMERYTTYLKQVYEYNVAKKTCFIRIVKGDHAVHQNYPERIRFLINEFLIKKTVSSDSYNTQSFTSL